MIKEITTFIENKTSSFTRDVNLFAGHIPMDKPDQCSAVIEGGGGVYPDLVDRADAIIQVLSRADSYFNARNDAWEIYNAIFANHPLGSSWWELPVIGTDEFIAMSITPLAIPQLLGQDSTGRYRFSTNYIFRIRDKNA